MNKVQDILNFLEYQNIIWESGIIDGSMGGLFAPGKLNVKTGFDLAYILDLVFFLFSIGCCLFTFFGLCSSDLGFCFVVEPSTSGFTIIFKVFI